MLNQSWIAITCILSNWYIHDGRKERRLFACAIAILGQPAWFYAAWIAHQWGILFVDVIYTGLWLRGLLKNWRN